MPVTPIKPTPVNNRSMNRPAITIPQIVSGIPLIANLLAAWGVFTPTAAQQTTLRDLLVWGFVLIGGDAAIRVGRNLSDGMKARAAAR